MEDGNLRTFGVPAGGSSMLSADICDVKCLGCGLKHMPWVCCDRCSSSKGLCPRCAEPLTHYRTLCGNCEAFSC